MTDDKRRSSHLRALDWPDCRSLLINVEQGRGSKPRGDPAPVFHRCLVEVERIGD